jgi:hypothetical protein
MELLIVLGILAGCVALMAGALWVLGQLSKSAGRESFDQSYQRRGATIVRVIGAMFGRRGD